MQFKFRHLLCLAFAYNASTPTHALSRLLTEWADTQLSLQRVRQVVQRVALSNQVKRHSAVRAQVPPGEARQVEVKGGLPQVLGSDGEGGKDRDGGGVDVVIGEVLLVLGSTVGGRVVDLLEGKGMGDG